MPRNKKQKNPRVPNDVDEQIADQNADPVEGPPDDSQADNRIYGSAELRESRKGFGDRTNIDKE